MVHLLRTEGSEVDSDWVPSARMYEDKVARIRWTPDRVRIFGHHYKHAIILAWGSDELRKWLSDFCNADDEQFARLYDMETGTIYDLPSPPPSSAVYF